MSGDLRPESGGCQATSLDPCYLPSAPSPEEHYLFKRLDGISPSCWAHGHASLQQDMKAGPILARNLVSELTDHGIGTELLDFRPAISPASTCGKVSQVDLLLPITVFYARGFGGHAMSPQRGVGPEAPRKRFCITCEE